MVLESDEIFDAFVNLSKRDPSVRYFPASPKNRLLRNKENEVSRHSLLFDIIFDDDNTLDEDIDAMKYAFEKMKNFDRKLFSNVFITIYPGKKKYFASIIYEKIMPIIKDYMYHHFSLSPDNYVEYMQKAKKANLSGLIVFARAPVLQQIEETLEKFALSGIHCYTWDGGAGRFPIPP